MQVKNIKPLIRISMFPFLLQQKFMKKTLSLPKKQLEDISWDIWYYYLIILFRHGTTNHGKKHRTARYQYILVGLKDNLKMKDETMREKEGQYICKLPEFNLLYRVIQIIIISRLTFTTELSKFPVPSSRRKVTLVSIWFSSMYRLQASTPIWVCQSSL